MLKLLDATGESQLGEIKRLFEEYAEWLGFDLGFQDFKDELAGLPGDYVPPHGCLLLARQDSEIAGCVALRGIDRLICEMKRLYVRPQFRGSGVGRRLSVAVIERAREIGYAHMRLDTVPWMKEAIALYVSLGFREIEPYRYNPIEGAMFMQLDLSGGPAGR